jgi:hypothetical protein
MIKFASETAQTDFHLLPIDRQIEWLNLAMKYMSEGKSITVVCVEHWPEGSEVNIRISQEFDIGLGPVNKDIDCSSCD